ncbi:MAG: hypothetical protein ACFB8W_21820 [Elainellaceae cyanobacterium]
MRLTDIVNQSRRKISEWSNFARHPQQMLSQRARRQGQQIYESVELPGQSNPRGGSTAVKPRSNGSDSSNGKAARGKRRLPLVQSTQERPQPYWHASTGLVSEPHLVPPDSAEWQEQLVEEIQEELSSYAVGKQIWDGGQVSIYEGTEAGLGEPVWIHVYRLSEDDFDEQQIKERQKRFSQLIQDNLKLGNGPDFRIIKLKNWQLAKLDNSRRTSSSTSIYRCYLITKPIADAIPLAQHLEKQGAMSSEQVRLVLFQVLDTLRYLHNSYQTRWLANTWALGLPHGNINLESLWLRQATHRGTDEYQFFIYLSDFALWAHLFDPKRVEPADSIKDLKPGQYAAADTDAFQWDLKSLGTVAFELLNGSQTESESNVLHLAQDDANWQPCLHGDPLKQFVLRLLGGELKQVEVAIQALKNLPARSGFIQQRHLSEGDAEAIAPPQQPSGMSIKFVILFIAVVSVISALAVAYLAGYFSFPKRGANPDIELDSGSASSVLLPDCFTKSPETSSPIKIPYVIVPNSS